APEQLRGQLAALVVSARRDQLGAREQLERYVFRPRWHELLEGRQGEGPLLHRQLVEYFRADTHNEGGTDRLDLVLSNAVQHAEPHLVAWVLQELLELQPNALRRCAEGGQSF